MKKFWRFLLVAPLLPPWGGAAESVESEQLFLRTLNFCNQSLKAQSRNVDNINACGEQLNHLEEAVGELSNRLDSSTKESIVEKCEGLLTTLRRARDLIPEHEHQEPELSSLVGLENSVLHLLLRVKEESTWSAQISAGGGGLRKVSHSWSPLAKFELSMRADFGNTFDGGFAIAFSSPYSKSDGFVELPTHTVDSVRLREMWVRLKRARALQFRAGVFSEPQPFVIEPESWPFSSLQGVLQFTDFDSLTSLFRFRHDRLSFYDSSRELSQSVDVERNLSELNLTSHIAAGPLDLKPEVSARFHWYADPENILPTLALGHGASVTAIENAKNVDAYRIFQLAARVPVSLFDAFEAGGTMELFRNTAYTEREEARGLRVFAGWRFLSFEHELSFFKVSSDCATLPPIQFADTYLPGFQHQGLELKGVFRYSPALRFTWRGRWQSNKVLTGQSCTSGEADVRSLPEGLFEISASYDLGKN